MEKLLTYVFCEKENETGDDNRGKYIHLLNSLQSYACNSAVKEYVFLS